MSLLVLIARYYEIKLFVIIGVMNNEEVEELTSLVKEWEKIIFWEEYSVFGKNKEVECKQRCISKIG